MRKLNKITFLLDKSIGGSPGQQLLDRFLMGYPRDGRFHRLAGCQVAAWTPNGSSGPDLERRAKDFRLLCEANLPAALAGADGIIVAASDFSGTGNNRLLEAALADAPNHSALFVYGVVGGASGEVKRLSDLAKTRRLSWLSGTATAVTWRLPDVAVQPGTRLREALIVVQGSFPHAELEALDGVLPLLECRPGGEAGCRHIRYMEGPELWRAGVQGEWSWPLLAAALSRSDSPQGDAVLDGRTQDLVGLGLVPKLARAARGWLLEHADGLRSTLLILDGVVADINFAIQSRDGRVISAQLYQPPPPEQHQFSRLAACIEDFFTSGKPPWPLNRGRLVSGLLGAFNEIRGQRVAGG